MKKLEEETADKTNQFSGIVHNCSDKSQDEQIHFLSIINVSFLKANDIHNVFGYELAGVILMRKKLRFSKLEAFFDLDS
eukprot:snap_masked-scaffold_4-processed-gene-19.50-mRNA-1 protein AED:1.00 eAED:1.00 QI:0/-1/0/0/-1/1/1/0/78